MGTISVIVLLTALVFLIWICPEEGAPHGYQPEGESWKL